MLNHQDWETVTIHKNTRPKNTKNKDKNIAQSIRGGEAPKFEVKHNSSKNTQSSNQLSSQETRKYDQEEIPKLKQISQSFKINLQTARQAKGWTQKELAQRINEKQTLVSQYESGQAVPNPAIMNKMERVLGTRLREAKK